MNWLFKITDTFPGVNGFCGCSDILGAPVYLLVTLSCWHLYLGIFEDTRVSALITNICILICYLPWDRFVRILTIIFAAASFIYAIYLFYVALHWLEWNKNAHDWTTPAFTMFLIYVLGTCLFTHACWCLMVYGIRRYPTPHAPSEPLLPTVAKKHRRELS